MERVKRRNQIERVKRRQLEEKQRVKLTYAAERQGTIVRLGPEVSEVKWDDGDKQVHTINKYLQPL